MRTYVKRSSSPYRCAGEGRLQREKAGYPLRVAGLAAHEVLLVVTVETKPDSGFGKGR